VDRILWQNHLKFNPGTDLPKLDDKALVVYPMKTCRQTNNVDCGVFILHFIDQFVGFGGSDKEQVDRDIWNIPLNVEQKRREIEETLKVHNLASK
jgi:Ulp1 family protease